MIFVHLDPEQPENTNVETADTESSLDKQAIPTLQPPPQSEVCIMFFRYMSCFPALTRSTLHENLRACSVLHTEPDTSLDPVAFQSKCPGRNVNFV